MASSATSRGPWMTGREIALACDQPLWCALRAGLDVEGTCTPLAAIASST